MSDTPSREEIKAQIEASEARSETKVVELRGLVERVLALQEVARAEAREDSRNNRNMTIAMAGVIIAVIALLATFGHYG